MTWQSWLGLARLGKDRQGSRGGARLRGARRGQSRHGHSEREGKVGFLVGLFYFPMLFAYYVRMLKLLPLVLLLSAFSSFSQSTPNGDYNLPRLQRASVRAWLKMLPNYRVAVENDFDRESLDLLTNARNEELGGYYQPYYAEGDFNRDSIMDFAVAIINESMPKDVRFTMAIFHGKADGSFPAKPFFIYQNHDLSQNGLIAYGHGATRLSISSLGTWHATTFTFVKGRYRVAYD